MESGKWKRPENVPFPSVWRRFEGKKPFPNGKKPRFRVQDFTEDLTEDVLNNMKNCFLPDEPLSNAIGFWKDAAGVAEMESIWREYMEHKLVLVCLLENKEELGDDSLPILVGCNLTGPMEPNSPHPEIRNEKPKMIFDFIDHALVQVDWFKKYNVDVLMYALGLSVDPRFRGMGIGLEILKARYDMGRAVGIKLTMTAFTAISSQTQAERAGFETEVEVNYDDYKIDGKVVFDIQFPKSMKIMVARIS